MPTTKEIAQTDEGRFYMVGNVLINEDLTGADPAEFRLRSKNRNIGKYVFDRWDQSGNQGKGGWVEGGYISAKQDERPGHEDKVVFEFWRSASHDLGGEGRLFEIGHDYARSNVPLNGASGPSPSPRSDVPPNEFRHPDGIVWFSVQGDGNLVIYQNRVQWDYSTGRPIFATGQFIDPSQTVMRPKPEPVEPPTPTPTPHPTPEPTPEPAPHAVTFRYLDQHYTVEAGDFATMRAIFGFDLDRSDIVAYHNGDLKWQDIADRWLRKATGNT